MGGKKLKFLGKLEISSWFNCNKMDKKVVTSIKHGWNTIVWTKIRNLRQFVKNLLGVKVHASFKILKFCRHFGVTKTHWAKFLEFYFILSEKTKL